MKFMCRAFSIILCLIVAVTCVVSVSAEDIKYNLKELKLSLYIPDSMAVKTRDNSTDLAESIYLEATNSDNSLFISVSMIQNEKTKEIYSFQNMPYSTIEEYKEQILENDGYIECKDGEYGGVPFLDFSQKYTTDAGVVIYGKQSVTLVNGMSISITSQSAGDSFTSDELNLIKNCLESIKFDTVKTPQGKGVTFWGVFLWIVVIILVLAAGLLVLSYYMGKRSAEKKKSAQREKQRKANYDVLQRAENKQKSDTPGGYKTSSEYFEQDFDNAPAERKSSSSESEPQPLTGTEKAVRSTKKAFVHMGYFFSNLKKEINKSKKKPTAKRSRKSKAAQKRRKSRDYDVFSDN